MQVAHCRPYRLSPVHRIGLMIVLLGCAMTSFAVDTPWMPVGPQAATVFSMARDPGTPDTLYAGTFFGGMYVSVDGGISWQHLASHFSDDSVFGIAVDPATPATIFAATFRNGIARSSDGGQTWSPANNGFTVQGAQDVAVDPNDSDIVLAASAAGVFRSVDGGGSWVQVGGPLLNAAVRDLLFVAATPGRVYAASSGLGVYFSNDSGLTWQELNGGLGAQNVIRLEYESASGALFAATTVGAFHLASGSSTWQDISFNLPGVKFNHVLPRSGATVLAATDTQTYALDFGTTSWVPWSDAPTQLLSVHPGNARIHVAAVFSTFLYTDDDGANFENAMNGIQNRFVGAVETLDFEGTPLIYAGTDFGIDVAAERFREDPSPPFFASLPLPGATFDVVAHPTEPGRLFAGNERGGVWRSDFWGLFWEPSSDGIVPSRILAMDQAPTAANPLYVGSSSGVYISYDNGLNWVTRTVSDTAPQVTAIAADPERPGHAYSGADDGRIFRTIDFGDNFLPTWQEPNGDAIVSLVASRFFNIYAVTSAGKLYTSDDIGLNYFERAQEISEPILSVAVDPVQPWVVYVGTAFGGVYKSASNAIEWENKSSGIDQPLIFSLLIDPNNVATIYAGAKGRIFRSDDAGESWIALPATLPDGFVSDLHLDSDSGALYASVDGFGIHKSIDGGNSWTASLGGAGFDERTPLAQSHIDGDVLFAGAKGSGIHRSTDAGANWAPSNEGIGLFVRSIAIDPTSPDTMFATSIGAGVFKSTDGGNSWMPKGVDDGNLFHVLIDKQTSSTVYVGTAAGISRSLNGGDTWEELAARAPFIFKLLTHPTNPGELYAIGAEAKIFRSNTRGATWETLPGNGLPTDNYVSGAIDPTSGALFIGSENFGVFRLAPGTGDWQSLGPQGLPVETKITDIHIPAGGGAVYIATTGGGFFASLDMGGSWFPVNDGIASLEGAAIETDPFAGSRVFAGVFNIDPALAGLYLSEDGGLTWSPTNYSRNEATALALSPHVQGRVFAAGNGVLERSDDGGTTWSIANFNLGNILSIAFDAIAVDTVYVGNEAGELFVSHDNGMNWISASVPNPAPIVSITPDTGTGEIYVGTLGDGVLTTADDGASWQLGASTGLWDVPVLFVEQDPLASGTLYAATGGQGMHKTTDGGIHWNPISNGIDTEFLLTLALDDQNPQTLYAGTAGSGIFITEDGGINWRPFNEQLFNKTITAIDIQHLDNTVIYVGTEGGGLFKNVRD